MATRKLTENEIEKLYKPLIIKIRKSIRKSCGSDEDLYWAFRRKVAKELTYDERGKPSQRKALKRAKRKDQKGNCAICAKSLPDKYAVLDRLDAMKGYTKQNTRLIHQDCDYVVQNKRRYR